MNVLEVKINNGQFFVPISFIYKGTRYNTNALISTIYPNSYIPISILSQGRINDLEFDTQATKDVVAGIYEHKFYQHAFQDFKLDEFDLGDVNINIDCNTATKDHAVIGLDILIKFNVLMIPKGKSNEPVMFLALLDESESLLDVVDITIK